MYQSELNGWTISARPSMKYALYGCIVITSLQFVFASLYQNVSELLDERYKAGRSFNVALSFRTLHNCNSSSLIRSSNLRVSSSIIVSE